VSLILGETSISGVRRVVPVAEGMAPTGRSGRRPRIAGVQNNAHRLAAMATSGQLDREAVERVLAAAGHRRFARPPAAAGLTARETEVLRLAALGLTTRQTAKFPGPLQRPAPVTTRTSDRKNLSSFAR
jgi:hypothetical protein